jgi:C1A family cysteine protease
LGKNEIYNANVTTEGIGRHAVVICGFLRVGNDFVWICRNSWSESFGNQGFFLCSHAYVSGGDERSIMDIVAMQPFEYYDENDFLPADEPADEIPKSNIDFNDPNYIRQYSRNIIGFN